MCAHVTLLSWPPCRLMVTKEQPQLHPKQHVTLLTWPPWQLMVTKEDPQLQPRHTPCPPWHDRGRKKRLLSGLLRHMRPMQ